MENVKVITGLPETKQLPFALSARDIQKMGFSRSMSYRFLNMADLPTFEVGGRKFMHRDMFMEWLGKQAAGNKAEGNV